MDGEPYLRICSKAANPDGAIVTQGREVVEQGSVAVAIAELQVVADVRGLVQVMAVVTLGEALSGVVGHPGLIDVGDDLVARGGNSEAAGLDLVAGALLFALIAIEDAQRDVEAKAEAVVD